MFLAGASLASCSGDGEEGPTPLAETICVNTLAVDANRAVKVEVADNTFTVLFWLDREHLETGLDNAEAWSSKLYLAGRAPQPVAFYEHSVFDLRYPYPKPEITDLYATGYAPGTVLTPGEDYRTLTAEVGVDAERGRYDFMSCDAWCDVYRGSQIDPFAQDRNKLYFRHLAAKLRVFADRDEATMENRQYVRNVQVSNLYMSIDGGKEWIPMHTPSGFEWQTLEDEDFTDAYSKTIETVKTIRGNLGVTSHPAAGYKTVAAEEFAGDDPGFVLQRKSVGDRVPIYGMFIDSCYVCNPFADKTVRADQPIRLKMDITAEMSYDPNFPLGDEPSGTPDDGSGSTTDNLTFTRTWTGRTINSIEEVDADGQKTGKPVTVFEPGCEYRIYIHFYRTGVDLVARKLPWNDGGSHYIPIPGGDPQDGGQTGGEGGETGGEQTGGETGGQGGQTGEGGTRTCGRNE